LKDIPLFHGSEETNTNLGGERAMYNDFDNEVPFTSDEEDRMNTTESNDLF